MASRTTAAYATATLAGTFMFAGVMFLMVVVKLCQLDVELDRSELVQCEGVGVLLALTAAVYSLRATVQRQGSTEPGQGVAEVGEWHD